MMILVSFFYLRMTDLPIVPNFVRLSKSSQYLFMLLENPVDKSAIQSGKIKNISNRKKTIWF